MAEKKWGRLFDKVAPLYDETRPGYPEELYADIEEYSKLPENAQVLEIGCGTGQATMHFADKGYNVLCIEKGESLASFAKKKFLAYSNVEVVIAGFEDYKLEKNRFNLVFAATAFHWLDEGVKYAKTANILKPKGALAIFWNKHIENIEHPEKNDFFRESQSIYKKHAPNLGTDDIFSSSTDQGDDFEEKASEIGEFENFIYKEYFWAEDYDTDTYIKLLNTYSNHLALTDKQREGLFSGIKELINSEFGGKVTKQYVSRLHLARKSG